MNAAAKKSEAIADRNIVTPSTSSAPNPIDSLQVVDKKDLRLLEPETLTDYISKSWNAFESFDRAFMAEARKKLIPLFDEVKRRIDNEESVNGCKTYSGFCESLGIDPAKVRVWRMRAARELSDGSDSTETKEKKAKLTGMPLIIAKLPNVSEKADYIDNIRKRRLTDAEFHEIGKKLEAEAAQLKTWADDFNSVKTFKGTV